MVQDVRWQQRFSSFRQSLANLQEVYARRATRPLDRVELQALIKSFELCYETGWNLMKDWLDYQGATGISGARDAIRSAVSYGLIPAAGSWMDMLLTRNRTAHAYNYTVAREVEEQIVVHFYPDLLELATEMEHRAVADQKRANVHDIPGISAAQNQELRGVFAQFPDVETVRVYGSRAKGQHKDGSDIDLCIHAPDMKLATILQIEQAIDDLALPYTVDLSAYHSIENPALREHIDRVGIFIYQKS